MNLRPFPFGAAPGRWAALLLGAWVISASAQGVEASQVRLSIRLTPAAAAIVRNHALAPRTVSAPPASRPPSSTMVFLQACSKSGGQPSSSTALGQPPFAVEALCL